MPDAASVAAARNLGQGGLFEPEKPRRLLVPRAATAGWWGCDPSTKRYVVGTVGPDLIRRVHRVQLGERGPSNGERLGRYVQQLDALIVAMLEDGCPEPGAVWVEQASGRFPVPELVYAVGVCAATFYVTLRRELGHAVTVEIVPSKSWKATLARGAGGWNKTHKPGGKGTKAKMLPTMDYKVLQWARLNGYAGEDWDDADALGIAEGARKTFALLEAPGTPEA